jgi:hypothetical protein
MGSHGPGTRAKHHLTLHHGRGNAGLDLLDDMLNEAEALAETL